MCAPTIRVRTWRCISYWLPYTDMACIHNVVEQIGNFNKCFPFVTTSNQMYDMGTKLHLISLHTYEYIKNYKGAELKPHAYQISEHHVKIKFHMKFHMKSYNKCYLVYDFIYEISYEMHYNRKFHMNVAPPRPTKWYFSGSLFPTTRRFICTGLPIINLRRSDDRLRFIMGIPIPVSSQWIEALYHILPCPISHHNGVSLHSPF